MAARNLQRPAGRRGARLDAFRAAMPQVVVHGNYMASDREADRATKSLSRSTMPVADLKGLGTITVAQQVTPVR